MNRNRLAVVMLIIVSVIFLVGLTGSTLSISGYAPNEPLNLKEQLSYFDWRSYDARDLGPVKTFTWAELMKLVEAKSRPTEQFHIYWEDARDLLENNLFWFTRMGINKKWFPGYFELDMETKSQRDMYYIGSYHIRMLLTDSTLESTRNEFFTNAVNYLNSPEAENAWYTHKSWLLEQYRDMKDDPYFAPEYLRITNATYKASLRTALDTMIKNIETAEFNHKVLPSGYGWWEVVQITDNVIEFIQDESPMRIKFACWRLGRDASMKLRDYARLMLMF